MNLNPSIQMLLGQGPSGGGPRASTRPTAWQRLQRWLFPGLEQEVRRASSLANWLDARFDVGGLRFGAESIIGLVPGVGDTATLLIGLYPLLVARRHRLGRMLQARMAANLLTDWLIGLLPVAGDLADTFFKAHFRNARLLEKAAPHRTSSRAAS